MSNHSNTIFFSKGDLVFKVGDEADCAYIIESGTVGLYVDDQTGSLITTLNSGELLGEMGVIDSSMRLVSAYAESDLELMQINKTQITQRLQNSDPIIRTLMNVLLQRIRNMTQPNYREVRDANKTIGSNEHNLNLTEGIHKIRFEKELFQALENGDVVNVYQPMVNLDQGYIAGFEALSRWKHPEKGMISPFEFITLAEESDLIVTMGLNIFDNACRQLSEFQRARKTYDFKLPDLFMSINVSMAQLSDAYFFERIKQIAEKYKVKARNIKIEITESMLAEYGLVRRWIKDCHNYGFKISLDDFGTGYSGFQHLLELDFDSLKIDQAFIKAIESNPKSLIMLEVITEMAKRLGMSIVAEGIENLEGAETLASMGVDFGQGYYFFKPMNSEEIISILSR